jgi:hypothetical protein
MAKVKDLTGKKFKRLTVISFIETRGKSSHAYFKCKCKCGNIIEVRGSHLKENNIVSCGCYAKEIGSKILTKYANSKKHIGKGNPQWKGDKAKYSSIHSWLKRHFNKDNMVCQHCNNNKKLDFALLKNKKYIHNRDNFILLCRSCHIKYDRNL